VERTKGLGKVERTEGWNSGENGRIRIVERTEGLGIVERTE
jgi:hypothetical protein